MFEAETAEKSNVLGGTNNNTNIISRDVKHGTKNYSDNPH